MKQKIELSVPIYWQRTKKTKDLVSLNNYRNWHHYTSNKFKSDFESLIQDLTKDAEPIKGPYTTHYALYYGRANCDGPNIVPIVEKVVLDALVKSKLVQQDSVKWCIGGTWDVAGKDAENPRCEVTITEV